MIHYNENIFLFCALLGTGLLIFQLILSLFGISEGDDPEVREIELKKFKFFSIQTLAGFLMMFGWTAISCQKEFHFETMSTIFLSFISGSIAVFILTYYFKFQKNCKVRAVIAT